MNIDINIPTTVKVLSSLKPGTVFLYNGEVYEKSAEVDPDGDIVVMRLSDGTIHRYTECTVSALDVTLIETKKNTNVPIHGGYSVNLC